MKHLTRWLAIMTFMLMSFNLYATSVYYIANNGNDANDGLSPETAWQTLGRVKQAIFPDGAKILLKRGETFRGEMSLHKQPQNISFDAYGEGAAPILKGSVVITGWKKTTHPSLDSSKVYEADVTPFITPKSDGTYNPIQYLFSNDEMMTIARYPNVDSPLDKNWLTVDKGTTKLGKDSMSSQALIDYKKPNNYWNGAIIRLRNYSWSYRIMPVTAFNSATGKLMATTSPYNIGGYQLPEWGFFIDDKLEEIDHPGEWYYDQNTRKIYLYPKNNANPNNLLIEGMFYGSGITLSNKQNGATIQNLNFQHYTDVAIAMSQTNNVTVQHNIFIHNLRALKPFSCADLYVANNYLNRQIKSGFELFSPNSFDLGNTVIEKNYITNTAMYRVYGWRYKGEFGGIPISVFSTGYTVRKNFIDTSSYVGISLHAGGEHVIENNVITNTLALLNDGGAITYNSDNTIVRGNFTLNSIGNVDDSNGCMSLAKDPCNHHTTYGMGVGSNSKWIGNTIEGNTVANNQDVGIRLNAFINTTVKNNLTFNNDVEVRLEDELGPSYGNVVQDNTLMPLHPDRLAMLMTNDTNHGRYNGNFYCNPYSDVYLRRDGKSYSLPHWKLKFPQYSTTARECSVKLPSYKSTPVGGNLITKGSFDVDESGWVPVGSSVLHDTGKLDSGSLKVVYPANNGTKTSFTISLQGTFSVTAGTWYRVSFDTIGQTYGGLNMAIARTKPEYVFVERANFAMANTRKSHEYYFQAEETSDFMKLLFTITEDDSKTYWIDNIAVTEAQLQNTRLATEEAQLFMNPTERSRDFNLGSATYKDLNGNAVTGNLTLAAYSSKILMLDANSTSAADVDDWDEIRRELVQEYVGHIVNPDAVLLGGSGGSPTTPPTPPVTTLAAPQLSLNVADTTVNFTWTAVANATSYEVYYSTTAQPKLVNLLAEVVGTSHSIDVLPGAAYHVTVVAKAVVNGQEIRSANSNVETFDIPAQSVAAPQLTATVNGNNVTLSWTSIPNGETYYVYYAPYPNAESLGKFQFNGNSVSGELAPGSQYYFAVIGFARVNGKLVASEASNVEVVIIPQ
ncbi:right-handed parallel beta-helix repeat-containing protein [Candidatus Albibeggiatoa sp. nov. NOAA]|uniref:right-handed parallel beta-helix repeat-containing protein n=1 Tax=Candidatus Albibeggiatoa sp. nov. NOAA TaxID=3162724 RepID=UPI0032F2FFA5|nr:right-handed parallel beta-helix repeat-containing protein [Thiotrichaceae bacterium]